MKSKTTYTKRLIKVIVTLGLINGTIPYVLSLLNKEPVVELGIAWVTEVVAVVLGYLCKAYFETKQEKKQELENYRAGMFSDSFEEINIDN